MRHRILIQTDPTFVLTGLSENVKTLLKYLWKTNKYDIAHMCVQGTSAIDPKLNLTPWKSFGSIPPDQGLINQINSDPQLQRNACYGAYNIDSIIKKWKPTIWIGSNDAWSFPISDYMDKPWYSKINCVPHITIDSIPVCDMAFDQAKKSKYYLTWAKFAAREMKRARPDGSMNHVSSIYGAMDINLFSPISSQEKADMRKRFGLNDNTIIFQYVFRNQLRKSANLIMEAYSRFKREHKNVATALHFHTSFSEKGMGWDIPKMATFYGIDPNEILCTYVCKTCKNWIIASYRGEDIDCPICKAQKTLVTPNIQHGVPPTQMRFIYGIADAGLSIHTSGGQELTCCQTLLCGNTLGCTNYASGEDFCNSETSSFVAPIGWHPYHEQGTNFIKAASDVGAISSFMRHIVRQPKSTLQEAGKRGREWAISQFGIETIGAQWEKLFDSMIMPDWSTITLTANNKKNQDYVPPDGIDDDVHWIKLLYKNILLMDVTDQDEGVAHWREKLKSGVSRGDVLKYFIQVANQENSKNSPPQDFGSLLDNTGNSRVLFLLKESIGDVAICTALFKSIHNQHPNTDLYVATEPKYFGILEGNEYIHKLLPYMDMMQNELAMIGQGTGNRYFDFYYNPAIQTQRQLSYLGRGEPAFNLT